jgi:predicted TIM-barrel fold metal-dependent hydrolase
MSGEKESLKISSIREKRNKDMTDNHVHIGWYTDGYHSPLEVWRAEQQAGIDEIVVSSTSTCAELYKLVVREIKELNKLGGSRIHPILWITPKMMKTWGISYMIHSRVRWEGIKLHWQAHREWYYNNKILHNALEVARWMQVPVLLHTGDFKECHAKVFLDVCKKYDALDFVLAHGWPIDETMDVMSQCPNVRVDTAFMPAEDVKLLCDNGFAERVLFGTDAPINLLFYKDMSTVEYIRWCISNLKDALTPEQFEIVMNNKFTNH